MESFCGDIPIVGIDKTCCAFLDSVGNRYFEVENDIFALEGKTEDGAVGYHGSGSHGGHIVLKPFYERLNGQWVNQMHVNND